MNKVSNKLDRLPKVALDFLGSGHAHSHDSKDLTKAHEHLNWAPTTNKKNVVKVAQLLRECCKPQLLQVLQWNPCPVLISKWLHRASRERSMRRFRSVTSVWLLDCWGVIDWSDSTAVRGNRTSWQVGQQSVSHWNSIKAAENASRIVSRVCRASGFAESTFKSNQSVTSVMIRHQYSHVASFNYHLDSDTDGQKTLLIKGIIYRTESDIRWKRSACRLRDCELQSRESKIRHALWMFSHSPVNHRECMWKRADSSFLLKLDSPAVFTELFPCYRVLSDYFSLLSRNPNVTNRNREWQFLEGGGGFASGSTFVLIRGLASGLWLHHNS